MANKNFTGISTDRLNDVLQGAKVKAQLLARAQRALPAARAVAMSAGATEFAKALHVEEGTRPGTGAAGGLKRPYARVVAQLTPEMKLADKGSKLTRQKILRRGASGG